MRMSLPSQYVDLGVCTKTRPTNVVVAPVYVLFNRFAAKRLGAAITKTLVAVGQGNDPPRTALVHASALAPAPGPGAAGPPCHCRTGIGEAGAGRVR
ncbi:hypothetical protein SY2F82_62050 [Streptomyces sp. Y2F8-2]|nr:hypothetical protein SY2F82_62050 [Streptomyces sp. Y2F8-2]